MLFKKEYEAASDKIYEKRGFYVDFNEDDNTCTVYDGKGKTLMEYLSIAQLEQLANIL